MTYGLARSPTRIGKYTRTRLIPPDHKSCASREWASPHGLFVAATSLARFGPPLDLPWGHAEMPRGHLEVHDAATLGGDTRNPTVYTKRRRRRRADGEKESGGEEGTADFG